MISGLDQGQERVMEYFKDLLTVKDEDGIDKEGKLEQAKAYALDEIFTDNTNLSLNVQEDEILGKKKVIYHNFQIMKLDYHRKNPKDRILFLVFHDACSNFKIVEIKNR